MVFVSGHRHQSIRLMRKRQQNLNCLDILKVLTLSHIVSNMTGSGLPSSSVYNLDSVKHGSQYWYKACMHNHAGKLMLKKKRLYFIYNELDFASWHYMYIVHLLLPFKDTSCRDTFCLKFSLCYCKFLLLTIIGI